MGRIVKAWRVDLAMAAATLMFTVLGFEHTDHDRAGYVPPPRDESWVRILTWNVGGKDGEAGAPLADDAIAHVATTLKRLDPDLAFLQEVRDSGQMNDLLARLGGRWRGAVTPSTTRRLAVLCSRGTITIAPLSGRVRRRALAITYRKSGGPVFGVIALHADAYSAQRRNAQIGKLVDLLVAMPSVRGRIFAGDLNLDLDLDKRRDLFSSNQHLDVESYNYLCERLYDAGVGRGSTADPDRRLDYIFIDAGLAVIGAGPVRNCRTGAMDHDPVVADLLISKP